MSRYFFHVFDDRAVNLVRDLEGASFPNVAEAKKEAIGLAQDIVGHRLHGSAWQVVVIDDKGQQILSVLLAEIRPPKIKDWLDLIRRVVAYKPQLRPHVFTCLLMAALFATIMHAAVLTGRVGKPGSYKIASSAREGLIVRVRFIPQASVADVSKFLEAYKASLVGGPQPAGVYQLQLSDISLPHLELERIVNRITHEKIVAFASATQ
jgi:hypothetical protein